MGKDNKKLGVVLNALNPSPEKLVEEIKKLDSMVNVSKDPLKKGTKRSKKNNAK